MSGSSVLHVVKPWQVLSWADWQDRLYCSYVTARKRVAAMVRAGQLQQLPVCPRCGRVSTGPACQCGRRFGRGPSYAYAAPGEPPCIKVPVHRRKYRQNYIGSSESPSIPRPNTDSMGDSDALPPYLNSDTSIMRALLVWGWTLPQVQAVQASGLERWELVRAWVPIIHRMQDVRNKGGYAMTVLKRGTMPRYTPSWAQEKTPPPPVVKAEPTLEYWRQQAEWLRAYYAEDDETGDESQVRNPVDITTGRVYTAKCSATGGRESCRTRTSNPSSSSSSKQHRKNSTPPLASFSALRSVRFCNSFGSTMPGRHELSVVQNQTTLFRRSRRKRLDPVPIVGLVNGAHPTHRLVGPGDTDPEGLGYGSRVLWGGKRVAPDPIGDTAGGNLQAFSEFALTRYPLLPHHLMQPPPKLRHMTCHFPTSMPPGLRRSTIVLHYCLEV